MLLRCGREKGGCCEKGTWKGLFGIMTEGGYMYTRS